MRKVTVLKILRTKNTCQDSTALKSDNGGSTSREQEGFGATEETLKDIQGKSPESHMKNEHLRGSKTQERDNDP